MLPLTWSLVCFCCHWSSAIKCASDFLIFLLQLLSIIDRPLINPQFTWSSSVDCLLILISDPIYIARSHWPGPWYYVVVTDLLLSNITMIFEKILHLHSIIDRPLISTQLPWYSIADCGFICISDNRSFACSHQPGLWSSYIITDLLLSKLPLILESFPCTWTQKMIDPWSIPNYPGLLLLIVGWFSFLTIYILLPLTRYLILCCHHWYSAIKYSPEFLKTSLRLYSTIDILMINPRLPWSSDDYCRLIRISDPGSIAPADPVSGILLLSLVFWYQIFLWFSRISLALALHHW